MGGTDGPSHFNDVMDLCLQPVIQKWEKEGRGFWLRPHYHRKPIPTHLGAFPTFSDRAAPLLSHQIWADNLFLYANSMADLRAMLYDATNALEARGLRRKSTSLQILANTAAHFLGRNCS